MIKIHPHLDFYKKYSIFAQTAKSKISKIYPKGLFDKLHKGVSLSTAVDVVPLMISKSKN